jgi:hypothetical protein
MRQTLPQHVGSSWSGAVKAWLLVAIAVHRDQAWIRSQRGNQPRKGIESRGNGEHA